MLLVIVWMEYSFFFNGKLFYCGINVFQMVKIFDGWQVYQVIDICKCLGCIIENISLVDFVYVFVDVWYKVVVEVDEDIFFGSMVVDGIYFGIDVFECWLCDIFQVWVVFVFECESVWDFKFY